VGDSRLTSGIDTGAPRDEPRRTSVVEQVLEALPSGVVLLDEAGHIRLLNPAAIRILGLAGRQPTGTRLTDLRGEYEAMLWPTHKGEVLLLDRAGGRVLGFTSRRVVSDDARGTVVVFSDITQGKADAKAADHRRRLADVGTVVATLAHEIRNPVHAIRSLAALLRDEDAILADSDLTLIVGKILDETRRVSRLVDDTLGFARDRALALGQVDVPALFRVIFEDVAQTWEQGVQKVPLRMQVESDFEDASRWRLDEDAGRQAFANLVRNAVQAVLDRADRGPDDGVDVLIGREGPNLLVEIVDDGVGIPPEMVPRVTEPFFTSRPTGTGLGLAVADRVIRQHGGTLRITADPGQRTSVAVRLPR
jgi:nitrogen fixation/metabolism regulation signal transduction histidine kinase